MQTGELTLQDYVVVLRRRWPIIVAVTALLTVVAFGFSVTREKQYLAEAEVLIDYELSAQITDPANQGRSIIDRERRTENELRYASGASVTAVAEERLNEDDPEIEVTAAQKADILVFSATDSSPQRAALIANTFAEAYTGSRADRNAARFTEAVESVETLLAELRSDLNNLPESGAAAQIERDSIQQQIQTYESRRTAYGLLADANKDTSAEIVNPAEEPESPVSPKPARTAALALALGLLASTGLAVLLEFLDDRVRTKDELEAVTRAPTLALIPRNKEALTHAPSEEPDDSLLAESFRSLRTSLRFAALRRSLRSVQITSANPNEGKTTVACYLALAMARLGNPVVLIDADLRNPSVHRRFNLGRNDQGLAAVLLGQASIEQAMRSVPGAPNLRVLPAGPAPANPADFLWPVEGGSGLAVPDVIDKLVQAGHLVIVDSPPVLPVTDSVTLSRTVEGTIFVANAGSTRARAVQRAFEQLDQADARLVGAVLNRSADAMGRYRYGYRTTEAQLPVRRATPPPIDHSGHARPAAPVPSTIPAASQNDAAAVLPAKSDDSPSQTSPPTNHHDHDLLVRLRQHLEG